MDPSLQFGGYVDPPSHLSLTSKKPTPRGRPAELRTIPDYDYSLFRYSKVAIPSLILILATAGVLLGLSFWQGPFGYKRGPNGFQEGVPRDYHLDNIDKQHEAGLQKSLRSLRSANFVTGLVPLIVVIFVILSEPTPGVLRGVLCLAAFFFFCLGVMSAVSFALGIDQVQRLKDCPDMQFMDGESSLSRTFISWSPGRQTADYDLDNQKNICWKREQLTSATIAADAAQSFTAILLAVLLVYTTTQTNWAWGTGHVPVEKNVNQPRIMFPPPSPFTHIAETRRIYVWATIFFLLCFVLIAFILTIIMHELRQKLRQVDYRGAEAVNGGWAVRNNRFRVSMAAIVCCFGVLSLMDLISWRRRAIAYLLATGFFWLFIGLLVIFSMDVKDVNDARDRSCPNAFPFSVKCMFWRYFATCFVEFALAIMLICYVLYEYVHRVYNTWDTYYFYADSEWLRNHSLFVDQTDREAFDWKRFIMDSGKEYFYSPSLGISTRMRPRGFVEPPESPYVVGGPEQFAAAAGMPGVAAPVVV